MNESNQPKRDSPTATIAAVLYSMGGSEHSNSIGGGGGGEHHHQSGKRQRLLTRAEEDDEALLLLLRHPNNNNNNSSNHQSGDDTPIADSSMAIMPIINNTKQLQQQDSSYQCSKWASRTMSSLTSTRPTGILRNTCNSPTSSSNSDQNPSDVGAEPTSSSNSEEGADERDSVMSPVKGGGGGKLRWRSDYSSETIANAGSQTGGSSKSRDKSHRSSSSSSHHRRRSGLKKGRDSSSPNSHSGYVSAHTVTTAEDLSETDTAVSSKRGGGGSSGSSKHSKKNSKKSSTTTTTTKKHSPSTILTTRTLQPPPYFYYIDRSTTPDIDPLTPLSPPLCVPNFVIKLHTILIRKDLEHIICWMPHGRSWNISNVEEFEKRVLPDYFKQSNVASFYRQANGWGFRR